MRSWPSPAGGVVRYARHRPETTLLYQLVDEYYPAFADQMAARGTPLPEYVQREFEDYLKCGRLEHGFLRLRCESCHAEHLVAFSCTNSRRFRRAPGVTSGILPSALRASLRLFKIAPGDFVCPSCGARRMADDCMDAGGRAMQEQLPKARRCWSMRFCPRTRCANGC